MKKWMKTALKPGAKRHRRHRLLNAAVLLTGLLLAVVLGILWTRLSELLERRSWLIDSSSRLLIETIEFESTIGFGGFIHNYKNAVLRPAELYHLVAAEADLARALDILSSLEGLTRAMGTPVDLDPIREALAEYGRRVAILQEHAGQPIMPRDLDDLVRVQTVGAVDSLVRLIEVARQDLEARLEELRTRIERLSDWFALAAALLTALMIFLLTKRRVDSASIQDLAGRRAEYIFDLMVEGVVALTPDRRIIFLNSTARGILGPGVATTPCIWPETIHLHPRDPISSEAMQDDLLAKALSGRSFQGHPALLSRSGNAAAEPVRVTSRQVAGDFLYPIETVLVLLRDPPSRNDKASAKLIARRPSAES
jgi:PAS domain-containing protein